MAAAAHEILSRFRCAARSMSKARWAPASVFVFIRYGSGSAGLLHAQAIENSVDWFEEIGVAPSAGGGHGMLADAGKSPSRHPAAASGAPSTRCACAKAAVAGIRAVKLAPFPASREFALGFAPCSAESLRAWHRVSGRATYQTHMTIIESL